MRRVFFSFHYDRDAWSVAQVRNSWLANPLHETQPFQDRAAWEQVKRRGDLAIKEWIDSQLKGSSVTVVLIGPETLQRRWVRYEIEESLRLKMGLIGVTLEGIKQANQGIDNWTRYQTYGPFDPSKTTHSVYSWIQHEGRQNLGRWIEKAATEVNR
jgi:MTH538 TIR-like domain (DUF1863)